LKIYANIYEKSESKDQNMSVYSQMQIDYAHTPITSYMLITEVITVSNILFHRTANAYIPSQTYSK